MPDVNPAGWSDGRFTLGITAGLLLLNLGVFPWAPPVFANLLTALQFDPVSFRTGEWWRLLTANLVHWDPWHLLLDGGAFLFAGLLWERYYRGLYPLLLLTTALVVGGVGLWWVPEGAQLRGLSGVNAGQFAAAVVVECILAYHQPSRWWWVAPATVLFLTWLLHGATTGQFFAGALFFSDSGQVAAWAHLTGAIAAACFVTLAGLLGWWAVPVDPEAFEDGSES